MALLDSVAQILGETGPLHYREITKQLLKRKLWATKGKTPEATVNARISVDIKDKGEQSRFRRTRPGVFELSRPLPASSKHQPVKKATMSFIGSTLSIYPAASVVAKTARRGTPLVIVNQGPTEHDDLASVKLDGPAGTILPALVQAAL